MGDLLSLTRLPLIYFSLLWPKLTLQKDVRIFDDRHNNILKDEVIEYKSLPDMMILFIICSFQIYSINFGSLRMNLLRHVVSKNKLCMNAFVGNFKLAEVIFYIWQKLIASQVDRIQSVYIIHCWINLLYPATLLSAIVFYARK